MQRRRADLLLVAKGLAASRAQAQAAIEAGGVRADGVTIRKASDLVAEDAELEFTPAHPWVSRGGVKLAHALATFGVDPAGRICVDVGASTGGFTDVLITLGAAKVYAVDVGSGQLHPRLAADARVIVFENRDARALTRADIGEAPTLIVCDVSFIGAAKALATPLSFAAPRADLIVLIKPQFEAGPGRADKNGVLPEAVARAVADEAVAALDGLEEFRFVAATDSPIRGGEGNLERLAHFRRT